MSDNAASILARLKNKAKTSGISYQQCLQLFFQEEFLRKLAISRYSKNFILKEGLFIYTLTNFKSRATVDIDFLMRGLNNELFKIDEIISEIISVNTGNDYIIFKASKAKAITPQRKYHGVNLKITGYIKNIRVPFDIDIGVGDVVIPSIQQLKIQPQLDGFEKQEILTYSLESTVAEKLDAILQRLALTSRMKDFYDIYELSHIFDFKGPELKMAILATIKTRKTPFNDESFDNILALADNPDMQVKWKYFLKTLNDPDIPFKSIIDGIQIFLQPVCTSILAEKPFNKKWAAVDGQWNPTTKDL